METPIIDLVTEIMEEGKFNKTKKSDAELTTGVERTFKLHRKEQSEESARVVYNKVAELAKLGRGELANKFALRFEEEIGYEDLKED